MFGLELCFPCDHVKVEMILDTLYNLYQTLLVLEETTFGHFLFEKSLVGLNGRFKFLGVQRTTSFRCDRAEAWSIWQAETAQARADGILMSPLLGLLWSLQLL